MKEEIWERLTELQTPGFFITAEITHEGKVFPSTLEEFVYLKLAQIRQGITARKFTFHTGGWRIYITFFPTDHVVDERYALKNKMIKRSNHKK